MSNINDVLRWHIFSLVEEEEFEPKSWLFIYLYVHKKSLLFTDMQPHRLFYHSFSYLCLKIEIVVIHGLVWEFPKEKKKLIIHLYISAYVSTYVVYGYATAEKNSLSLFQTSVNFFSYLCLIGGNNCDSWFRMRILLCVLHKWKIAKLVEFFFQKCFT